MDTLHRFIFIMSMTRNGVVYNLHKSPYILTYNNIDFYFSSLNHMDKFKEKMQENRDTLRYSLYKRFKIMLNCTELFDINLYFKVETRGFLLRIGGEFYTCVNQVRLDGVKKIEKK